MSFSYKIKLTYKGTGYFGWQIQSNPKHRTIQGELERVLRLVAKSDDIKTLGASRTDAGVHACGQVARITIPINIPEKGIIQGVNSLIDPAIQITDCRFLSGKFNPISEAVSKEYLYYFTNFKKAHPFHIDYFGNVSFDMEIEKMKSALKYFLGRKDFKNFRCVGTDTPDSVREIFDIELTQQQNKYQLSMIPQDYFVLRINGSGFLKQMVRMIVGTLWSIGRGKRQIEELKKAFDGASDIQWGPVAPAAGLYLNKIEYKDGF